LADGALHAADLIPRHRERADPPGRGIQLPLHSVDDDRTEHDSEAPAAGCDGIEFTAAAGWRVDRPGAHGHADDAFRDASAWRNARKRYDEPPCSCDAHGRNPAHAERA